MAPVTAQPESSSAPEAPDGSVAVLEGPPAASSSRDVVRAERRRRRPYALARTIVSTVLLVVAIALCWPAQYGGLVGLTVVHGDSMEPTYRTGDLVVSVKKPHYGLGDVVSYVVPVGQAGAGGRVIHRISALDLIDGEVVHRTTGDNNPTQDDWEIRSGDIMGAAVFSVPSVGAVLGGTSNPLILGLICGVAVTIVVWRMAPSPRATPAGSTPSGAASENASSERRRRGSRRDVGHDA